MKKYILEPSEHQIQKDIMDFLKLKGVFCWRNNSGKVNLSSANYKTRWIQIGTAGLPDIIGILKGGRMLGIEVKSRRGKLTELQEEMLEKLKELGACCGVARSIEDVINILEKN